MNKNDKTKRKRIILIAAVLIGAVLLSVISSLLSGTKPTVETVIPKELLSYNDNVLLVSSDGIQLANSSGKSEWSVSVPNSDTIVRTRGKYVLLSDLSANNLHLTYGASKLGEYASESRIISANVNRRGDMAVACDETGYKGMLVLLDKKGREKYRWHCSEGYLTDVDLSADGRFVAASLIITDERPARSKLIVLDIKSGTVFGQAERPDSVIGTVKFTDSGRIITVADNELIGYDKNGTVRFEVSFGGRQVSDFNIDNEDNIVIAVVNSKNNNTLEIYSKNGKLRGSYEAKGDLKNITVKGGVTAANFMRDIYYINSGGKLKNTETCEHEIKDLCLFGDGRHVLAIGGNGKYSIIKIR